MQGDQIYPYYNSYAVNNNYLPTNTANATYIMHN